MKSAQTAAALAFFACASVVIPAKGQTARSLVPGLSPELLAEAKARVQSRDTSILPAYTKLIADADFALGTYLVAVTDKSTVLPPSNDKHDYFSLSPYWWPDPAKKDGLPYIRRDGETNPESKRDLDQPRVAAMGERVQAVALAYYFTGHDGYALQAAQQLRRWFLDSATKMNPHLRYAQLVRGNPEERGSGIIDTRWFIEAVQAAGLIEGSKWWNAEDKSRLQAWFKAYLDWLLNSPNGAHERAALNNHGSWYAAQTAAYALFVGDTALARKIIEGVKSRIGSQIKPDGLQPQEMQRTRSLHYSGFNIEALSHLAEMGRLLGIDLWTYQAPQGGSLQRAIDRVARYLGTNEKWPGEQIDAVDLDLFVMDLRRAERRLGGGDYTKAIGRLPRAITLWDRSALLYPDPR